jgi:hypothetical protein
LILLQGERHGYSFSLLHTDNPVFPATFVEEAVFPPSYVLSAFDKNKVAVAA